MGLWGLIGPKLAGHAGSLETEAGADIKVLRQDSFFSGKPCFLR